MVFTVECIPIHYIQNIPGGTYGVVFCAHLRAFDHPLVETFEPYPANTR